MFARALGLSVLVAGLLSQGPPRFAVSGTVDVSNLTLVSATPQSASRILIGTYVPLQGPSRLRMVDENGGDIWERKLEGKLLNVVARGERAMMVVGDRPGELRAEVFDVERGRPIRSVRMPLDQAIIFSRAGDALVMFDDPIQSGGETLTIRLVDSETSRTVETGFQVVGAAAANQDRVFAASFSGQLHAYAGRVRVWSKSLKTRLNYYGLSCSRDGKVLLVESANSPVVLLDGGTGQELLHFRAGQDIRGWLAERGVVVDANAPTGISAIRPFLADDGTLE